MKSSDRATPGRSRRIATVSVAGLVVLTGACLVGVEAWFQRKSESPLRLHREQLAANVDAYCAQEAALGADPWFHEGRTEGDAGLLLNAWLPWSRDLKRPPPEGSPLVLPEALREEALDLKQGRWLTANIDVSRLDFDWMVRLLAYDRWDLFNGSPLSAGARFNWVAGEVPDLFLLQRWAKFRMLQGLRTGHPLEAAQQVRHLAWLSLRTDSLAGGSLAVNLLDIERLAHASLASPPADWTPMSAEQTARMNALLLTAPRFAGLAAPPDVARQARGCATQANRCLALTETAFHARLLEPFADASLEEATAALDRDLSRAGCPTLAANEIRTRGVALRDPDSGMSAGASAVAWIPGPPGRWLRSRMAWSVLASALEDLPPLDENKMKQPERFHGQASTPTP
ncbi:hypothetical protein [Corallococcus aberystwythensis]|uniref:Uncharacterized protein n=1 Tax=Corallococcus aberystwythensis TaxID=2316722 RepID=A0A3A8R5B7_9BACT|nr:hypothetical protein [Corallococcus aberystwythensis]RKH74390.1 hypothetical protein D7W81_01660 [Corallococcus aberystwythensis]